MKETFGKPVVTLNFLELFSFKRQRNVKIDLAVIWDRKGYFKEHSVLKAKIKEPASPSTMLSLSSFFLVLLIVLSAFGLILDRTGYFKVHTPLKAKIKELASPPTMFSLSSFSFFLFVVPIVVSALLESF
jgi:hypothetical protein